MPRKALRLLQALTALAALWVAQQANQSFRQDDALPQLDVSILTVDSAPSDEETAPNATGGENAADPPGGLEALFQPLALG